MNLFFLKKAIGLLLMPLSIVILLLFIAIIFYRSRQTLSFLSLFLATSLLVISSYPPISQSLISSLEDKYPVYNVSNKREHQSLDFIVVLGCYHFSDAKLPATIELKTCSLQRLVEAIRLANLYPEASLIMSGSAGHNPQSNAVKMKEAAILMGINPKRILIENTPRDTEDEAILIAPLLEDKQSVLITNADHMHRSLNYFNQHGATPTPAPASFYAKGDVKSSGVDILFYLPKSSSLQTTSVYWYETLGLTAQWFKQLLSPKEKSTPTNIDANQELIKSVSKDK